MTLLKYLIIYWLVAIVIIYFLRNCKYVNRTRKILYKVNHLFDEKPSLWERIKEHLFLVFVMPWLLPLGIPFLFQFLYKEIIKQKVEVYHDFTYDLYGLGILYYDTPIKNSKYTSGLSDDITITVDVRPLTGPAMGPCSVKQTAQESNWLLLRVLKRDNPGQFEQVKSCYQVALDDGVFEAANNLGVLAINIEDNLDKGIELLSYAASHGSQNAMINLFSVLWNNGDYKKAIRHLKDMSRKVSPSLKCLWNLAVLSYYGHHYPHNTIKADIKKSKIILNKIIDYNGNDICENEKDVPKKAESFLCYLELPF